MSPRNIRLVRFNKNFIVIAIFMLIYAPVNAGPGMDTGICCMQAAREQFSEANPWLPWDACGVDPAFDFLNSAPSPSVNVSLGWCKNQCPGYQRSSASQWLQPLATWVIPALTLLILCSVGEEGRDETNKWPFYSLLYQVKEYIALLGDPASAICGAFTELWMDTLMARRLTPDDKIINGVIGIAMLASPTELRSPDSTMFMLQSTDEKQGPEESSGPIFQKERSISEEAFVKSAAQAGKVSFTDDAQAAFKDPIFAKGR